MESSTASQGDCNLTYVTLRAAFLLTLDSLLRYSLSPSHAEQKGSEFLHFYPPLQGMAPQIQMECVLRTWNRWSTRQCDFPSPLDARILYAATELLASLAEDRGSPLLRVVFEGPRELRHLNDHWLPAKARCLQLTRESTFSRGILQELSLSSDPQEQVTEHEYPAADGELMEILGRWRANTEMLTWGNGLLTPHELELVRDFFEEHDGLTE
jgi:hypothetical protein